MFELAPYHNKIHWPHKEKNQKEKDYYDNDYYIPGAANECRNKQQLCNETIRIIFEELLKHDVDVHAKSETGKTAMHYAVYHHNIPMMKLLSAHGADINAQDNIGFTPYFYAWQSRCCSDLSYAPSDQVKCFMDTVYNLGADPSIKDNKGHTAKYYVEYT